VTEGMRFEIDWSGQTLIVNVADDVGSFANSEVMTELSPIFEQLDDSAVDGIVVDFHQVDYFGSSMLEALRGLWSRIEDTDRKMVLCSVSSVGKDILEVARFDTLWPICADRQAALDVVREA